MSSNRQISQATAKVLKNVKLENLPYNIQDI